MKFNSNNKTAVYNGGVSSPTRHVLSDEEAVKHTIDEQQERADRTTSKYKGY